MENMRFVLLSGGLGNQLYQYAFGRVLEIMTKEKCIFNDSCWWGGQKQHNGYEMEKVFGLKLNLLSNYFSEDVRLEMARLRSEGISIPQQLLNNGINLILMAEFEDFGKFDGNVVYMTPNGASQELFQIYARAKGNIYYHGYWVNSRIVNSIKPVLQKELVFPEFDMVPDLPKANIEYMKRIRETDSIALHIRRGDFIQCGRALSKEKYAKAVAKMEESHAGGTYFVFSDDMAWCEKNKQELGLNSVQGEVVYVTGNTGNGYNYVDMQLMSNCKNMIISNSSFGAWAYYLNTIPNVDVIVADQM